MCLVLNGLKNEGQQPKYEIDNSHPAIVSCEIFDLVQAEIIKRKNLVGHSKTGKAKYVSKYPLSGLIQCGECGSKFRRYASYYKGEKTITWVCINHKLNGKKACKMLQVKETDIINGLKDILNALCENYEDFKNELIGNVNKVINDDEQFEIDKVEEDFKIIL